MRESETIEFKKSLADLKAGLVSIAAILNKHGRGELWFGIRSDGKAVGLDANEKTLRDISQAISAHIEPRIYPHVSHETVDNTACIKVAFEGQEYPYYAYGRAYMRVADEDRQLSAKALEDLILSKNSARMRWDNETCRMTIDDLDRGKLKDFIRRAGLEWDNPENALDKLGLLRDGKLLNAAPLFFSKSAPMELRCAVFGTTDSAMIIDRHDIKGDVLELIEEAQKYVLKNIHIGMRIEGLYRKDVPEISSEAMREAIINAFCHRDYRDPDYVQVAVYKDRVEIRNPGGLFGGITIDDLRKGHISKRRNSLIAELFRRIEMVEAWGRGMPLILKYEPNVEFKEIAGIFIAAFRRPSFTKKPDAKSAASQASGKKPLKESSGKKFGKESSGKTGRKILDLLSKNGEMTIPELAGQLDLTTRAVEKQIAQLRNAGQLVRTGGRKAGRWEVQQ